MSLWPHYLWRKNFVLRHICVATTHDSVRRSDNNLRHSVPQLLARRTLMPPLLVDPQVPNWAAVLDAAQ